MAHPHHLRHWEGQNRVTNYPLASNVTADRRQCTTSATGILLAPCLH